MTRLFPTSDCAQAREAASARLDGELAGLDLVRLEAHLDACNDCRAVANGLTATATLLRGAPLEEPDRSLILLTRSSRPRSLHLRTAAAAAAVLAVTSFSVGHVLRQHSAAPVGGASLSQGAFPSAHLLALLPASRLSAPHMIRLGQNLPV